MVLLAGAEPFFFKGGPIGCLLSHGFTASPQEMRELGLFLNQRGYTVLGVRLAGHGTHWQDLSRSRWSDWRASVEDGFHMLRGQCEQIIPIGLSTGSMLNLILAAQVRFTAIVAMATPSELPDIPMLRLLYPFLPLLSRVVPRAMKGKPDWRDPQALAARVDYDCYPLKAVHEFGACVRALQQALPMVTSPLLLLHSSEDNFVPPAHSERIAATVASSDVRLRLVKNSNHVISSDAQRAEVFELTAHFIEDVLQTSSAG